MSLKQPLTQTLSIASEVETESLGIELAAALEPGLVIGLCGTLGSGKTRLTQAIAKGLGVEQPVVSPTYTLCIPYAAGRLNFLHMDAYRINHAEEVDELDLFERVESGEVLLIEWADRIEAQLPDIDVWITITPTSVQGRTVTVAARSEKGTSLVRALTG